MSTHGLDSVDTDMADADANLFTLAHAEDPGRLNIALAKRIREKGFEKIRRVMFAKSYMSLHALTFNRICRADET